eukprot:Phypoly_transcript_23003.p1 GENE.Phypoly_transcript_23003~~Phypoly_transcript_23003.p1  ORF type:complete len:141 (+),score=18.05 Phypoly_transcript_23003:50-472(+)
MPASPLPSLQCAYSMHPVVRQLEDMIGAGDEARALYHQACEKLNDQVQIVSEFMATSYALRLEADHFARRNVEKLESEIRQCDTLGIPISDKLRTVCKVAYILFWVSSNPLTHLPTNPPVHPTDPNPPPAPPPTSAAVSH